MDVHVTGELEAKLTVSAAKQGPDPDDLVRDLLTRYFEEEARFIEAVTRGEDALRRGDYLTHKEIGKLVSPAVRVVRWSLPAAEDRVRQNRTPPAV